MNNTTNTQVSWDSNKDVSFEEYKKVFHENTALRTDLQHWKDSYQRLEERFKHHNLCGLHPTSDLLCSECIKNTLPERKKIESLTCQLSMIPELHEDIKELKEQLAVAVECLTYIEKNARFTRFEDSDIFAGKALARIEELRKGKE